MGPSGDLAVPRSHCDPAPDEGRGAVSQSWKIRVRRSDGAPTAHHGEFVWGNSAASVSQIDPAELNSGIDLTAYLEHWGSDPKTITGLLDVLSREPAVEISALLPEELLEVLIPRD
jgi:hypothetical protein